MGSVFSRPFYTLTAVTTTLIATLVGLIYNYQGYLVYPSNFPPDCRKYVDTPDKYGIPFKDVELTTSDGEKLKAFVMLQDQNWQFYVPKTILIFCPNAGNMGHFLPLIQIMYQQMGYNVVIFSYRGYGKSTGTASEQGIKLDCEAVADYLYADEQIKQTSLIVYGRSIGGAIGIYFSTLAKARDLVKGIILENTFLSIPKLLPHAFPVLAPFSFLCTERWETEKIIGDINSTVPILFLGGKQDELVPNSHMKQLFEMSKSERKTIKEFEKGTHNDTVVQPSYWDFFYEFCRTDVEPLQYKNE
jgi:abhydrolase domain-containing protein 13